MLPSKNNNIVGFLFFIILALKLKAPRLSLKGKTFGINNTLVYPAAGIGLLGGAYLLFQMYGAKFNLAGLLGGQQQQQGPVATRVSFNVYPPTIKPFRKIRVQGQFESSNGVAATVPIAYYAIFESIPAGSSFNQRLMVSSGVLGQNVNAFRQDIATDNMRTGTYNIYISNKPITQDPLTGAQVQEHLTGRMPFTIG